MSADMLATLKNLDPALLLDPVRRAQRSPSFKITDWDVQPIPHAKVIESTEGLYHFSGNGYDEHGVQPWSIALKILIGTNNSDEDITNIFYWKREALESESNLLETLPKFVRAPCYYGINEQENGVWLWMEYLTDQSERHWSLERFRRAADQFGRFGGAYLTGTPLPQAPWLTRSSYRSGLLKGDFWQTFMNPEAKDNAWKHPIVQRWFGEPIRSYSLDIMAEIDHFCDALDRLPQILCHKDLNRRNLMFCATSEGQEELVAIDWAWCGSGAVGLDMGWMVVAALYLLDFDIAGANELEATVLDSYFSALHAAGWSGDERLARLGHLFPLVLWMATLPGWGAMMLGNDFEADTVPMYGQIAPKVLETWLRLEDFLMPHVDEMRTLLHELDL